MYKHNSKYNVGSTVYFLKNNSVHVAVVHTVNVNVTSLHTVVTYSVKYNNNTLELREAELHKSLHATLKKLKKNVVYLDN